MVEVGGIRTYILGLQRIVLGRRVSPVMSISMITKAISGENMTSRWHARTPRAGLRKMVRALEKQQPLQPAVLRRCRYGGLRRVSSSVAVWRQEDAGWLTVGIGLYVVVVVVGVVPNPFWGGLGHDGPRAGWIVKPRSEELAA